MGPVEAARLRFTSSLRGKTLLIIGVTMVGLMGGLYALSRVVLLRGFAHVENELARQNLERASSAMENELATLDRTTSEYAAWDTSYAFLHGKKPDYKAEFPAQMFAQLKVSFVAVLDNSGHVVFSKGFDLARAEEAPVPRDLGGYLVPGSLLAKHEREDGHVGGILMLHGGPAMVVSRPVLTSEAQGPIAGTMVMGRPLDDDELVRLAAMTHLPIEVRRLDTRDLPSDFRAAQQRIAEREYEARQTGPLSVVRKAEDGESSSEPGTGRATIEVKAYDEASVAAYEVLKDLYGKPSLILRVLLPRRISQQAQTSLLQVLLLLLASGLVFGAAMLYLLEKAVLSRVAALSEQITSIGASGDLSARIASTGKDELTYLGSAINGMLEDLEKTELDRHEGRTRLSLMVEKMPAVLWTTDTELRYTSSVGAGLEGLKVRPNEMVGTTLFEYFHTDNPEFVAIASHRKALAGESVTYEVEWQRRIFESHVQPLHSSEGELLGVIGVALDITDRKHLADQLRQSQKMQAVGELAGGVAHDFNNLLMVLKGHAEMMMGEMEDSSPLRHNVEQIEKAADRAAALTRQLLAFSRKQVLQPRVLDLNEVVSGMITMFSRVIGENIDMEFRPSLELGRVKADPGQMEQVLLNLVVNARDAMPDGGRLVIETTNAEVDGSYGAQHAGMQAGKWVMMTVSDTGCGMDAATQARIFEPFFTTKGQGKGTGLGLATVYGVVKQSGGFIWVYSEVDRGTTFKIYLPEVTAQVEKRAAEKVLTGPPPGSETILFVEDEESVRMLVRGYLEGVGYQVIEAVDGAHALEVAAAHRGPIHMLITDVVMPRLSGREVALRLGAARPELKVLYISGYTDDSIFRDGVLEGGMAFLQKPFNLKTLAQKIREVLDGNTVMAGAPAGPGAGGSSRGGAGSGNGAPGMGSGSGTGPGSGFGRNLV